MVIDSEEGKGTKVTGVFQLSDPDMKPTGDFLSGAENYRRADF